MKYPRIFLCLLCLFVASFVSAGDLEKADALFRKAQYKETLQLYLQNPSLQQNLKVQNRIGWIYHNAEGLIDYDKSIVWFKKAAEAGYPNAQYNLGLAYKNGKGVKRDYAQAMAWYQKAADQRFAPAYTSIGVMYSNGLGVKRDGNQAVNWYTKAADMGEPQAQCNLAVLYVEGKGIKKDYTKAKEQLDACLTTAPNQPCCLDMLSDMYALGRGIPKDDAKGDALLKKAAALGDSRAMYKRGVMYDLGVRTERDPKAAMDLYQKAAAKGDAYALYRLYEVYHYGKLGQPVDKEKAKYWKDKADAAMKAEGITRNTLLDNFRLMIEDK